MIFDINGNQIEPLERMSGQTNAIDFAFEELAKEMEGKDCVRRIIQNCRCKMLEQLPPELVGERVCSCCAIKARAIEEGYQPLEYCTQKDAAMGSSGYSVATFRKNTGNPE